MYIIAIGIILGIATGLCWGLYPIYAKKQKGTPDHWLLGSCYGMGISAFVVLGVVAIAAPAALGDLNYIVFLLEFLTGIAWTATMIAQFSLINVVGSAKGLSMANGGKTVLATFFSVFFLGTWLYNGQKLFGFLMIILIVVGVILINYHKRTYAHPLNKHTKHLQTQRDTWFQRNRVWIYLIALSVAAIGFSQFPSLIDKIQMRNGGWTNPYFASLVKYIPQSIGAFFGGIIIVFFRAKYITKDKTVFIAAPTLRNIVDGFIYAIGMICYLYAAFLLNSNTNKAIIGNDGIDAGGSTTAFALTNFANIVSALGGVFILKEKFTKREVLYFIIGTIILTVGAILVTFTDVFTFLKIWGKTTPIVS